MRIVGNAPSPGNVASLDSAGVVQLRPGPRKDAKPRITRLAKTALVAALAVNYTFIVLDNLTDFNVNYQFVRHVLAMDSTFSFSHLHGRAIGSPSIHLAFYIGFIAWEALSAILLWWGALNLVRALRLPAAAFNSAKRIPILALAVSLLMWLLAFLTVVGEWFEMWQSTAWNGQQAAFRTFAVCGILLLLVLQPDTEAQP